MRDSSSPRQPTGLAGNRVLLDTNYVVDHFRGRTEALPVLSVRHLSVSSVTLQELLGMFAPGWSYRYQLSGRPGARQKPLDYPETGPFARHLELGHAAVSFYLNSHYYFGGQKFLENPDFRLRRQLMHAVGRRATIRLLSELEQLRALGIRSVPLTERIVDTSRTLVEPFVAQMNAKANPRNSLNDLLILSTARVMGVPLVTRDRLLAEFASRTLGWTFEDGVSHFVAGPPPKKYRGRERRFEHGLSRPNARGHHR